MKLLKWTLSFFLFFSITTSFYAQTCNLNDSLALRRLGLSGTPYIDLSILPNNPWGTGPVHDWYGIDTIHDPAVPGFYRVLRINVSNQNISGSLRDSIFEGDSLNLVLALNIGNNFISDVDGYLRNDVASPAPQLKELDISYTAFNSGNALFFKYFTENLDSLTDFVANTTFDNGANSSDFTSYTLYDLPNLDRLDIRNNKLTGALELSNILATYPDLHSLYADDNDFSTLVPPPANPTSVFEKLYIQSNKLSDFEPLETLLKGTPSMRWLYAHNAMDTAAVQDDLDFDLGGNSLPNLIHLDISNNLLTGDLPLDFFEELPNIQVLFINNNRLTGKLPRPPFGNNIGNFTEVYSGTRFLREIDLSNNSFEGNLRIDWLFGAQLAQHSGNAGLNMPLEKAFFHNNDFIEIFPALQSANATAALASTFSQRFTVLSELTVENNSFSFKDLFRLRRIFRLKRINPTGQAHYVPQAATNAQGFIYAPQANLGIGGVRRRAPGDALILKAGPGIEAFETSTTNFVSNRYNWERIDTSNLAGGSPGNPVTQYIGQTQQTTGTTTFLPLTDNTGGLAQTDPSFQVGLDTTSPRLHQFGIENLDSLSHSGWLYRATVTNDSFPLLTLYTEPKKIEVGRCTDASGAPIHCQTMIVEFHPDTLAQYTPAQQDSLKSAIRESLGAEPIDECLCGDIELWSISDTASAMLEAFGTGTRTASTVTAAKPELLSADPNYSLLESTSNNLPDTVNLPSGSGNTTAKTLVAIIDSGVDYEYPALTPYISEGASSVSTCLPNATWGYNFLDDSNNASDDHGHGTAVAGIVAGISQQSILPDTGSMARDIGILPIKYTSKSGAGSLFHAACAIRYAADYKRVTSNGDTAKVRVINASWGYYGDPCIVLENVIEYVGHDCGILFVAAAGNRGVQVEGVDSLRHWPSNSIWDPMNQISVDNILAVAGVDQSLEQLAPNSNYGSVHIDVAAPWYETSLQAGSTNNFTPVEGTSFATPQVARAAALLFDKYPDATYFAVKYALKNGVDQLQSADSLKIASRGRINYHKADSILNIVLDRTLCSPNITVDVQKIEDLSSHIHVYPNPVSNQLTVELDYQLDAEDINLALYNVQGQALQNINMQAGDHQAQFSLEHLPSGVYFLQVQLDNQQWSKKIVKF